MNTKVNFRSSVRAYLSLKLLLNGTNVVFKIVLIYKMASLSVDQGFECVPWPLHYHKFSIFLIVTLFYIRIRRDFLGNYFL